MLRQSLFVCFLLALGACINAQQPDKCGLPVAEGNCTENIQRWFFNNRTGICQSFIYRGCHGNANNFNSTMYCYVACNVTSAGAGMYSVEEMARMLKAQQGGAAQQVGAAAPDRGSVGVTPATNFDGQRRNQPGVAPTGEPTLIQNRTAPGSPSAPRPRQPVPAQSASGASAAAGGRSSRNRRSTDDEHHQRRTKGKNVDSTTETGGHSNAVRKGHKSRSVLGELLEQMKSTAEKLEKAIETARTGSRKTGRRRGGAAKGSEKPEVNEEEEIEKKTDHADARHGKSKSDDGVHKKEKKQQHGDKMMEITLTADGKGRHHQKHQKPSEKKTVDASKKPESSSSGGEAQQQVKKEEENSAENDVEIVGDTIKSIIFDPSYVFSYQNITKDDMVSLQEIAAQSEVGTIKIVERREGEEDDDGDEDEIVEDEQETSTVVPDATTVAAAAEQKGEEDKKTSEEVKPVETPAVEKPAQELTPVAV